MKIWPIVNKDLLVLARDRRTFVLLLAMPIVFVAILGLNTGWLFTDRANRQVNLAFVDLDGSPLAEWILEDIAKDPRIRAQKAESIQHAERAIGDGKITAAIIIGPEFSQKVKVLEPIDLIDLPDRKLSHGLASLDIQVVSKLTLPIMKVAVGQFIFSKTAPILTRHIISRSPIGEGYIRSQPPISTEDQETVGHSDVDVLFADLVPSPESIYLGLVPAYTVMFVFFLITVMGRNLIGETQTGTLSRLHIAPIKPTAILVGKTLPFFLVSILQGLFMFLAGRLFFGMPWGSAPWLLLPVILSTSLAVTGLGLLLGGLAKTEAQVVSYGSFLVIGLAAISGCLMPRDFMPSGMQQISLLTPHAWALMAYDEVLLAEPVQLGKVFRYCGILIAFGGLFLALGLAASSLTQPQRKPRTSLTLTGDPGAFGPPS